MIAEEVRFLSFLAFDFFLLLVGLACIFMTNALREYAIKKADHKLSLFFGFMKSDQFIWNLRSCGLLAIAMSCIIAYALLGRSL